ncbi:hypothetical protein NDU88_007480 [Pleurodeles waltl]|uniref:Uncharacterized protein n=1 Tax=Pleurodeles waltl TaxID=8319 RepID=A0AAV7ST16_PLEWA|nr:hypothetical protein NDU88_007480 [Pleurodeles waltl]
MWVGPRHSMLRPMRTGDRVQQPAQQAGSGESKEVQWETVASSELRDGHSERYEAPEGATRPVRLSGAGPGSWCHLRVRAGLDYRRRSTHWARCGEGGDRADGVRGRAAAELCATSGITGGPRDRALATGGAAGGGRERGTGITVASQSDPQRRGRSSREQSKPSVPEGCPQQCERGSTGAATTRSSIRGERGGGDWSGSGVSRAGVDL